MTGSLQTKNGMYTAVLNLKDESGKRKQKRINLHIEAIPGNKRKAERASRETLAEYEDKKITIFRNTLFCDYVKTWFDEMRQGLQQTTIETYQTNIDKYIIPYFTKTGITLTDMTYRDVKNYYNHYSATLSTDSLKRHHAIIRPTLSQAVREGLIASNPATEIRFPRSDKFVGQFLSVAEGNDLLRAAAGTPLEPVVWLC